MALRSKDDFLIKKSFVLHQTAYVLVNLLLFLINWRFLSHRETTELWAFYPAFLWAFGLLGHGYSLVGPVRFREEMLRVGNDWALYFTKEYDEEKVFVNTLRVLFVLLTFVATLRFLSVVAIQGTLFVFVFVNVTQIDLSF
jgi:hypothetical protein